MNKINECNTCNDYVALKAHSIKNSIHGMKFHIKGVDTSYVGQDIKQCMITMEAGINTIIEEIDELVIKFTHDKAKNTLKPLLLEDRFDNIEHFIIPALKKELDIDIILVKDKCSKDSMVYSSPEKAKDVVRNCVMNAKKAHATKMIIEYVEREETIDVFIKDNGCGMDEEQLSKISLVTGTDGKDHGISMIRRLVGESGGIAKWSSTRGLGTTVYITLKKYKPKI